MNPDTYNLSSMNRLQLLKVLRKHIKLSEKRSVAFEQNKTAKYFIYIGAGFMFLYLAFIAIALAMVANDSETFTPYELLFGLIPFVLVIDFLFRFMAQQTPTQLVKPYVLLAIPRFACIDCFLVSSLLSTGNLIWMGLFVPYAIMSVLFAYGLFTTLGFLLGLHLLILINSQWYMMVRTLVNDKMWWWALPAVVYALIFMPWYIGPEADIAKLCELWGRLGNGLATWSPLAWLATLSVLFLLLWINRKMQYRYIYAELARVEKTEMKTVSEFQALNRFGEIGEYLKLEVKSIMRNKNIRKTFISANAFVLMFSLILSFTEVYDSPYMTTFWCIYNFSIYGAMLLVKIMGYEGNYIDCLMVHRENIISLLRAKYYFYSLLLLVPFVLMIPTLVTGKCTLLQLFSIMVFTAGAEYFLFMQMAVLNRQTIPLNTKFIGKGSMETNWMQVVVEMVVFIVPIAIISLLRIAFNDTTAYLIILIVGAAFIGSHRLWIRNIYGRMMVRRYKNIEGFRASR